MPLYLGSQVISADDPNLVEYQAPFTHSPMFDPATEQLGGENLVETGVSKLFQTGFVPTWWPSVNVSVVGFALGTGDAVFTPQNQTNQTEVTLTFAAPFTFAEHLIIEDAPNLSPAGDQYAVLFGLIRGVLVGGDPGDGADYALDGDDDLAGGFIVEKILFRNGG